MFIGHIKNDDSNGFELQDLKDHLLGTAERASFFASKFQNAEWGRLLGLWHDLGKYSDEFQEYIKKNFGFEDGERLGKTDHTSAAARSEEHTSELQSRPHLVCRLLLEKKKT